MNLCRSISDRAKTSNSYVINKSRFNQRTCYGDIPRDIPRRGVSQNLNSGVSPYLCRLNHRLSL